MRMLEKGHSHDCETTRMGTCDLNHMTNKLCTLNV